MLRLTLLSAAFYGVNAASHGNATNGTNATVTVVVTNAPTVVVTKAPTVVTTKAPTVVTTAAPAPTDAPTLATTKAPTVVTTKAPTVVTTNAPTVVTTDDPRVGCGNDTTSANCTTTAIPVIAQKKVTTQVKVQLTLDISEFLETERTALGNGIAYGIHTSACQGIKSMWTVGGMNKCLQGIADTEGISFDMAMNIDSQLVPSGTAYTPDLSRRLAEVTLDNSGDFAVVIEGAALTDGTAVADATAAIITARSSGAFQPEEIKKSLTAALNRTSVTAAIDSTRLAAATTSVATAVIETAEPEVVIVTEAPTTSVGTSGAYTAGVASALALIGGVFLF